MEIGIDIGGTKIAGGLVKNGRIIKRCELPTLAAEGKDAVLRQLKTVVDTLSAKQKIRGIGIGVPGLFKGAKVTLLTNIPSLNGVDLKRALKTKLPMALENDARCFALGEHTAGAGKGKNNMILIILGTGVGSGIIIDGKIYRGNGKAGEIGHIITDLSLASHAFGEPGEWEHLLSGPNMVRRHKTRGGTEDNPALIWRSTSAAAQATRDETIRLLTIFLANLEMAFDPDVIVLGGGLSHLPLAAEVNKVLPRYGARAIVKTNRLGHDAAIIGAAQLVR